MQFTATIIIDCSIHNEINMGASTSIDYSIHDEINMGASTSSTNTNIPISSDYLLNAEQENFSGMFM